MMPELPERSIRLDIPPEEAPQVVTEAVRAWGADFAGWSGKPPSGRLRLPVAAGLRHGVVHGTIRAEPAEEGSRVVFEQESQEYWLQSTSVALLCLSALGALLVILWPFFPPGSGWMQVAPLGAVLALAGWFLVTSRIITRDVGDFLDLLQEISARSAADAE